MGGEAVMRASGKTTPGLNETRMLVILRRMGRVVKILKVRPIRLSRNLVMTIIAALVRSNPHPGDNDSQQLYGFP